MEEEGTCLSYVPSSYLLDGRTCLLYVLNVFRILRFHPERVWEVEGIGPWLEWQSTNRYYFLIYVIYGRGYLASHIRWLVWIFILFPGLCIPRSHPGWIRPIGEFEISEFVREQAYRYSTLSFPLGLCSIREVTTCLPKSHPTSRIGETCLLHVFTMFCIRRPHPEGAREIGALAVSLAANEPAYR